ncbi:Gfo/Idh/MocA family oxidoreductase [Paenibacillus qinlingensis]|uniref:Dehydrogenase n=1 Tax=Paenibacillus qinlingensis TaxID=1837343 RepID=A0ABU1NWN9_9BACL|nr:Gfo/Idh/MocA family oxidoreductase [Paenibacillus qinlingensis]MDR6551719.1 putative dehydrogenase [Paenibacillus qinlingensis]
MKTYRIVVLGAGRIGSVHLREANAMNALQPVAVADSLEGRAKELASQYGLTAYTDYKEMIDRERPDIAVIALPPYLHKESAIYCASKGCHLLLEKPMALNAEECEEIIAAAKHNQVRLMIAHTMHYMAENQLAKQWVESGELGELVMINNVRHAFYFNDRLDWFFRKDTSGGGILMNLGCHSIDQIQWMTNSRVTKVKAKIDQRSYRGDIEGAGVVLLETASGIPATIIQNGYTGVPRNDMEFVFTKGSMMLRTGEGLWISENRVFQEVELDRTLDPYQLQFLDLIRWMETGEASACSGEYGKSVITVVDAIYKSHEMGKELTIIPAKGASCHE